MTYSPHGDDTVFQDFLEINVHALTVDTRLSFELFPESGIQASCLGVARFSCLDGGEAYNEKSNYSWNWLGPTGKCY